MIVFIDYEHADRYTTDDAERVLAWRTRITYRLEDLAGQPCMLVRWDRVSMELVERLGAKAIFISGNGSPRSSYADEALAPLHSVVRDSGLPVVGFCGGWQCMAEAFGAQLVPFEMTDDEADRTGLKTAPSGHRFEFGYDPVELTDAHAVLDGLEAPVFRHAHGLHIPEPPNGFSVFGRTAATPVQIAIDDDRRMLGTQFHPEYWTDEHPAGRTLIANFLRWADIVA